MKRFLICALAVTLLAGTASAQNLNFWLQDGADGDGHIIIPGVSNTAVIQLWMEVPAGMVLVGADAILKTYDSAFGKAVHYNVQGYNDITIPAPSDFQRTLRLTADGSAGVDGYQYNGGDENFPLDGTSGILGPRTVLVDEIIIHCKELNPGNPDLVYFAFGAQAPGGFEMTFSPIPPPGSWNITQLAMVDLGTGNPTTPLLIENVVPEPGTLGLLLLGGLAAIRRRR